MRDLVIVGSGPAGLSAAVYAKRAMMDVVVLEKEAFSGGQIVNTEQVDNYLGLPGISGFDMGMKFREHADTFGVEFDDREVTAIEDHGDHKKVSLEDGSSIETKAILIATGAKHRKLGVPGEEEFTGAGVSYCATCDGAFFRNKEVAVVGGGNIALEDALYLSKMCSKVHLIHRRDELRAAKSLQKKLMALPNVEIIWDTVVNEICGEDQVEALFIENKKTGAKKHLPVDGVFVAVGMKPNTNMVPDEIKKDEAGYIVADENCVTNVTGIFAAGDVRTKMLRQIITAAADGANAVESVQHGI